MRTTNTVFATLIKTSVMLSLCTVSVVACGAELEADGSRLEASALEEEGAVTEHVFNINGHLTEDLRIKLEAQEGSVELLAQVTNEHGFFSMLTAMESEVVVDRNGAFVGTITMRVHGSSESPDRSRRLDFPVVLNAGHITVKVGDIAMLPHQGLATYTGHDSIEQTGACSEGGCESSDLDE